MTTGNTIIADTVSPSQASPPKRLPGLRLALLSSILLWLACPAISLWPLAWVVLTPLLLGITRATRFRQAFWRGYLFGCVFLGAVWYWICLTVNSWSHSEAGIIAWVLLTLILSLYYGFWGGIAWGVARRTSGLWRITALAASWVVMEWIRTLGSLSMPWAQLSYSQYHFLPILQISEMTGAYGVTFLIALVNAALAEWWESRRQADSSSPADPASQERSRRAPLLVAGLGVALVFLYGLIRMAIPEQGKPLTVAVMQGDFSAQEHRDVIQTLETISKLTDQASRQNPTPDLYVWGESTAHDALNDPLSRLAFQHMVQQYHAAVTVGTVIVTRNKDAVVETNSALLFPPDAAHPIQYDKTQMVPFGEFIPFRPLLGGIMEKQFGFPNEDLTFDGHGTPQNYTDSKAGPVSLGPFICYESMFPMMARSMTRQGANLLVTQSNDDWFQSDSAMEQHLSAVVLRAIENRRWVARSTTTGVTCLLDTKGRIVQRSPTHAKNYVVGTVQLLEGQTLYTRLGDWFVLLCAALIVVALWRSRT